MSAGESEPVVTFSSPPSTHAITVPIVDDLDDTAARSPTVVSVPPSRNRTASAASVGAGLVATAVGVFTAR